MSKTVSELSEELGLSKQYLNRVLTQNNLGRKIGNKKLVSDMDEKALISILEGDIGNKKSETKKVVSDIASNAIQARDKDNIGNQKTETISETSFRYLHEQLEIKGKEVERLHQLLDQSQQLLDQSQQLLLNEQKKNQLLLEATSEPADWEKEKNRLENSILRYRNSYNQANQRAEANYNSALYANKLFWIVTVIAGILLLLLLVLAWIHFL